MLGQEVGLLPLPTLPTQETAGAAQDISDSQASTFASWWDRFTSIWPDFLNMAGEIADHQTRWQALAQDAYQANAWDDYATFSGLAANLDATERERKAVEDTVTRYRDGWDAVKGYLQQLGRWLGFGSPGLGLPPLILAVGIGTLIAAIAYVVTTYAKIRADLDFDRETLAAAEAGSISAGQAKDMIQSRQGGTLLGGLFSGGVQGLTGYLLLGGLAYLVIINLGATRR